MLENLYGCRFESARLKLELLLAESSLQWVNLEDAIGSPSVMRCLHSDIGDHAPVSNVTGNHWQNSNVAVNPMVNWFRCSFVLPVQGVITRSNGSHPARRRIALFSSLGRIKAAWQIHCSGTFSIESDIPSPADHTRDFSDNHPYLTLLAVRCQILPGCRWNEGCLMLRCLGLR